MFEELRAAFREALENFNKELKRDQVLETADNLLVGMTDEIVNEKTQVAGLEDQLAKTRQQAGLEMVNAETCRRRERMAHEIGDEETAAVAVRHAEKHENHYVLLQNKAQAIQEELDFRRRTLEEMVTKFTQARNKRDSLRPASGRLQTQESLTEADDLFSELGRMADKVEDDHSSLQATEELDVRQDPEDQVDIEDGPSTGEALDVDAALEELKRRMKPEG